MNALFKFKIFLIYNFSLFNFSLCKPADIRGDLNLYGERKMETRDGDGG